MQTTIMIVEDYDRVRALLREWLGATFPNCKFLEAKSGEEAIALVNASPPEIVLMDIGMGQMNGIEATRHIKALAPQAHVVMLTIHEDSAYRADAAAAGACAYVSKRKMQKELLPALKALLPAEVKAKEELVKAGSDGQVS
jgi:DNA-binding NarL/FixJ family response regulator